jgi:hypothetical protein
MKIYKITEFCDAEKCDNPPVRFGGHPTIFSWCSKEGARRGHQETENLANANISSQNAANNDDVVFTTWKDKRNEPIN